MALQLASGRGLEEKTTRHARTCHSTAPLGFGVGHVLILTRAEIEDPIDEALGEDSP